jgi:hypothetical protein
MTRSIRKETLFSSVTAQQFVVDVPNAIPSTTGLPDEKVLLPRAYNTSSMYVHYIFAVQNIIYNSNYSKERKHICP